VRVNCSVSVSAVILSKAQVSLIRVRLSVGQQRISLEQSMSDRRPCTCTCLEYNNTYVKPEHHRRVPKVLTGGQHCLLDDPNTSQTQLSQCYDYK